MVTIEEVKTKKQQKEFIDFPLKLYKGNILNAGVTSPYSLFDADLASFGESTYNQQDAEGFINLYGLPIQVQAVLDGKHRAIKDQIKDNIPEALPSDYKAWHD